MNTGHMKTIDASDFRAQCFAILDRIHETGERVFILKHGRPVAELSPVTREVTRYPQTELEGTVVIHSSPFFASPLSFPEFLKRDGENPFVLEIENVNTRVKQDSARKIRSATVRKPSEPASVPRCNGA